MAASKSIGASVGPLLSSGHHGTVISGNGFPDIAAVIANTATLVADGASPTQGHVTTLNGSVATLSAAVSGAVTVIFDPAKITTSKQLQFALQAIVAHAASGGYGGLTP